MISLWNGRSRVVLESQVNLHKTACLRWRRRPQRRNHRVPTTCICYNNKGLDRPYIRDCLRRVSRMPNWRWIAFQYVNLMYSVMGRAESSCRNLHVGRQA